MKIKVAVHAALVFRYFIHFQSLFDCSAMTDEARKLLSVNSCLMSAKQYKRILVL